jgi:hypothetical protein
MKVSRNNLFRLILLFVIFYLPSCRASTASPLREEEPLVVLTTISAQEQPTPTFLPPTEDIQTPTPEPLLVPPVGFKEYQDPEVGVSIFIPESWVATGIVEGQLVIFQSYPEDKYIGGEIFEADDTKCDLTIRPPEINLTSQIQEMKSNPTISIVSEDEMVLQTGLTGKRFVIDSMGRSITLVTEINNRTVVFTCFGNLEPFDTIASTLNDTSGVKR